MLEGAAVRGNRDAAPGDGREPPRGPGGPKWLGETTIPGTFLASRGGPVRILTPLLLTVSLLLVPPVVPAGSTPEAEKWLGGLKSIYEKGPFRLEYSVDMSMAQLGQGASMGMSGWMLHADPQHFRSEFEMTMGMPQAPGAGLTMSVTSISDGETLWSEWEKWLAL